MIARAKPVRRPTPSACEAKFLSLLPAIVQQARYACQTKDPERRQEFIAEVVANCWAAFVRLVERGLIAAVYPTPLAQYAIKQVRDGRRVGAKMNVRDVSSVRSCGLHAMRALRSIGRFSTPPGPPACPGVFLMYRLQ